MAKGEGEGEGSGDGGRNTMGLLSSLYLNLKELSKSLLTVDGGYLASARLRLGVVVDCRMSVVGVLGSDSTGSVAVAVAPAPLGSQIEPGARTAISRYYSGHWNWSLAVAALMLPVHGSAAAAAAAVLVVPVHSHSFRLSLLLPVYSSTLALLPEPFQVW